MTGRIPLTRMYVTRKNFQQHKAGITLDLRIYPDMGYPSCLPDEELVEIYNKKVISL